MKEKMLPQNMDAERAVLGSVLIEDGALALVDFLKPHHFYRDAHRTIFEAMRSLAEQHKPVDLITLSDELDTREQTKQVGGFSYLSQLMNEVPTSRNIEHYAHIVTNKWTYRELARVGAIITNAAFHEDENALVIAETEIHKIGQGDTSTRPLVLHRDALTSYLNGLIELRDQQEQGVLAGISTGYKRLDAKLGGLRKSKMYILAGRPGDGKTALALCIINAVVHAGCNVLFFSLEMEKDELMQRWVAMTTQIDSRKLRDGTLSDHPGRDGSTDWDRLEAGSEELRLLPGKMIIDDTPGNTLSAMRSKSFRAQAEHGIDLIVVDYLQFARIGTEDKYENRRLEVEAISRGLKALARELQVPVLALAQLNREVENRANRQPQLSDLREAGGIEQDCDVAMFIHKDPSVKKDQPDYPVKLLIEKNRNGERGIVDLFYKGSLTCFYPVDNHKEEKNQ